MKYLLTAFHLTPTPPEVLITVKDFPLLFYKHQLHIEGADRLAAVEQVELLEDFVTKYSAARERAATKAERMKQEKIEEGGEGSPA